jgi:serine-type D-Ala-D-Ala endopeptidase (penicillin-binding protein 7)
MLSVKPMRRPLLVASLSVVALAALLAAAGDAAARPAQKKKSAKLAKQQAKPAPLPALTRTGLPNIQAASAIIVDLDTGAVLYSKNPDQVRPIASVGKLFLALAVRGKKVPLEGLTAIAEEDRLLARGGARSRLPVGKLFTNHDLLRAMLISSDNRACIALGRAVGLAPDRLVKAMNATARALGLKRTTFVEPIGLRENVSTAREVVTALRAALADPVLAQVLSTPHALVRSAGGPGPEVAVDYFATTVPLRTEKRFPILGGKTGYTDAARYCLAIAAKIDGRRVAMVFLGAEGKMTRFADFSRGATWLLAGGGGPSGPGGPGGTVTAVKNAR